MLKTGQAEILEFSWEKDGSPVTMGAATLDVMRNQSDGAGEQQVEWLQADESWSTSQYQFALSQVGDGWRRTVTLPTSAAGLNLTLLAVHSDGSLPPISDVDYATNANLDDVAGPAWTDPSKFT